MNIESNQLELPVVAWVLLAVVAACLLFAIFFSFIVVVAPKTAVRLTDRAMFIIPAVANWVQFRNYRAFSLKRIRR